MAQFAHLLRDINVQLGFDLRIPETKNGDLFEICSKDLPNLRFMGKFCNERRYLDLKDILKAALNDSCQLGSASLHIYQGTMDKIYDLIRPSKSKNTAEKRFKKVTKQKGWGRSIKRVQRYLGLRERFMLAQHSGMHRIRRHGDEC